MLTHSTQGATRVQRFVTADFSLDNFKAFLTVEKTAEKIPVCRQLPCTHKYITFEIWDKN